MSQGDDAGLLGQGNEEHATMHLKGIVLSAGVALVGELAGAQPSVTPSQPPTMILVPLTAHTDTQCPEVSRVDGGVPFDIDGSGRRQPVGWPPAIAHVAILALDRNANGVIDDATEVLGNRTMPRVFSGFDALLVLEPTAKTGYLGDDQPLYRALLLWEDRNRNGRSEPEELSKADQMFAKIALGYQRPKDLGPGCVARGAAVRHQDYKGAPDDPLWFLFEVSLPRLSE